VRRSCRRVERARTRAALIVAVIVTYLIATTGWGAWSASADPSASWQITPTAGIQYATDVNGVNYPYVVMPTGGRWYLECPVQLDPATHGLTQSIKLNLDHDRCGNDQGSTASYYGSTWQTTTLASVNVDPSDVRCGQLIAHRADAVPPDAVSPVFCSDRVLV